MATYWVVRVAFTIIIIAINDVDANDFGDDDDNDDDRLDYINTFIQTKYIRSDAVQISRAHHQVQQKVVLFIT